MTRSGFFVLGVSRDKQSVAERFSQELELPYPIVGDSSGEIIRAYRARWPILGLAQRVTYVIDQDRRIRLAHHRELNIDSHVEMVCGQAETTESYHQGASFVPAGLDEADARDES